eukprot:Skav204830  [mRNA]  locus=scaffold2524:8325:20354:+ [translate_table: standard]
MAKEDASMARLLRGTSPRPSQRVATPCRVATPASATPASATPATPVSATPVSATPVMGLFELNLDVEGSGLVAASPDHNTGPGGAEPQRGRRLVGDYYFAWARDGALSMNAYLQTKKFSEAEAKMDRWIASLEKSQNQDDPNGVDVLVEPKFVIPQGTPFTGGWCRPQNDAPGLRAMTAMAYANKKPSMNDRVWALVKQDLEPWAVQAANLSKALVLGSDFAKAVGTLAEALAIAGHPQPHKFQEFYLKQEYCSSFTINQKAAASGIPGVLFGRYEGDSYDGGAVAAKKPMGSADSLRCHPAVPPSIASSPAASQWRCGTEPWPWPWTCGDDIPIWGWPKAENLLGAGDAVLQLMKKYLVNGMHMNEQMLGSLG